MSKNEFLKAVSVIVGTIIGAGILGIPYVVAMAGFWTGMIDIIFLGAFILLVYLYLGEVCLRTRGFHQLPGYAERYLGKTGKRLMIYTMLFGNYGAMIAYLIGSGMAISAIIGGNPMIYSIIFFLIMSVIVYFGLEAVCEAEMIIFPLIIGLIFIILFFSIGNINFNNLTGLYFSKILIPYGVILFAFIGAVSIPVAREELYKKEKMYKYAIISAVLISIAAYVLFSIAVVGVTGLSSTEVATVGLGKVVGQHIVLIGNILALLTMATSYLALGLSLKETYNYDYKLSLNKAWLITCIVPFFFLFFAKSFILVMSISGVLAGGLEGILIILMAIRAKKLGNRKPEYKIPINWGIAILLISIFVIGAGYYFYTLI